jgi:integrase
MNITNNNKNNIYGFTYLLPGGDNEKRPLGRNIMEGTLEKYKTFLGMKYQRKNTRIRYQSSATKYLNHIIDINQEETQHYVAYLNQTMRPNAVVGNIVGMNHFLDYIDRQDLKVSTPRWRPINRDTINKEQIIRLIDHARQHRPYMDYLILLCIRDLDTRNHEITRMRWDWIHGDKLMFQDCKTGDTNSRITPELKTALDHWRTITPAPESPYVFVNLTTRYKNKPFNDKGIHIRRLVNELTLELFGRRLNPQDLRASVITAEFSGYVNPKIIQLKARHRSEKTTQRYNHVSEEMVAEYIDSGTIFGGDKQTLFPKKPEPGVNKNSFIGPEPGFIPSFLMEENGDNSCFSFSVSFFQTIFDNMVGDTGGDTADFYVCFHRNRLPPKYSMRDPAFPTHTPNKGGIING